MTLSKDQLVGLCQNLDPLEIGTLVSFVMGFQLPCQCVQMFEMFQYVKMFMFRIEKIGFTKGE